MTKILYSLLLLFVLSDCISVSDQQRKAVQQFASKTKDFSSFPERIMTELADIRESRGIYYANSITDTETHLNELNAIFKERLNDNKIPGKVKSIFGILDKYAKGLEQLSSNAPYKSIKELYGKFGTDLELLINQYNTIEGVNQLPSGMGKLFTSTLSLGTNTYLAARQNRELKKYVGRADTLVALLCDEMVGFLSSEGLGRLISNEESGVSESFRFYLIKRSPPTIESEKEYIVLMKKLEMVKQLQGQSINAAKTLKSAHSKLNEMMSNRRSIKEIALEMNDFYKELDELRKLVLDITELEKQ